MAVSEELVSLLKQTLTTDDAKASDALCDEIHRDYFPWAKSVEYQAQGKKVVLWSNKVGRGADGRAVFRGPAYHEIASLWGVLDEEHDVPLLRRKEAQQIMALSMAYEEAQQSHWLDAQAALQRLWQACEAFRKKHCPEFAQVVVMATKGYMFAITHSGDFHEIRWWDPRD